MNEQIQKLVEQASKHVTATVPFDNPSYAELVKLFASQDNTVLNAFKEKFAELVVRECLDISYRESHLPNVVLFDERSDKFIKDIHNRVDRATREHFGVEE